MRQITNGAPKVVSEALRKVIIAHVQGRIEEGDHRPASGSTTPFWSFSFRK